MNITSRAFIAFFGISWLALSNLNIELGQRELTFSSREWAYFAQSIAGILLAGLSCLPRSLLRNSCVKWGFVPVIAFIEFGVALLVYRNLYKLSKLYQSLSAGTELFPERASAWMVQYAAVAVSVGALGVTLALCAARLLLKRNHEQH